MNKFLILFFLIFMCKAEAQEPSALAVGDSLYALGEYQDAIRNYKQAGEYLQVQLKLAKSYESSGNKTMALQFYKKAVVKNPEATVATFNYGKLLQSAGLIQQADSLFTALTKRYPNNANFYYELGSVKEETSDSLAMISYEHAYGLDSSHLNTNYRLARYAVTKRNFSGAKKYIDYGLEVDPNSTRFLTLQALSHFYLKEYHDAVAAYEKLLERNQGNEQLHEKLAISYTNTNQFEKAIAQYTVLINKYNDKVPSYHTNLAKAYIALKEYDKAIRHTEIAIVLQDISLEGEYLQLSTIYKRQGNDKKVFEMMGKAVKENPYDEMLSYFQVLAADNYFEDTKTVITYYERFLKKFEADGRYGELAQLRLKDLKEELFFDKE